MPLTQQGAITGRRLPRRDVDVINAMTPYLPDIYRQRESEEHTDRMYELRQDELAAAKESALIEEELARSGLDLRRQGLRQQKKQAEKAELMGWIGLGTSAGLGIADIMGGDDVIDIAPSVDEGMYEAISDAGITNPLLREEAVSTLSSPVSDFVKDIPVVGDVYEIGTDLGSAAWDWTKDLGISAYELGEEIFEDLFTW